MSFITIPTYMVKTPHCHLLFLIPHNKLLAILGLLLFILEQNVLSCNIRIVLES